MNGEIPIVLTAFGTSRSAELYDLMVEEVRGRFPGHEVLLAYSSRMVRDIKGRAGRGRPQGPGEALEGLSARGYEWAVVQSLHLVAGHEFYRLAEEVRGEGIRTSMGLPLLSTPRDFYHVAEALCPFVPGADTRRAVVFVGHGTDHPAWTAYTALEVFLRKVCGPSVWVGVVEGEPGPQAISKELERAGIREVSLVPLMLVAGVHFQEDLAGGGGDSWHSVLSSRGMRTVPVPSGLGVLPAVRRPFYRHIEEALDVIPLR